MILRLLLTKDKYETVRNALFKNRFGDVKLDSLTNSKFPTILSYSQTTRIKKQNTITNFEEIKQKKDHNLIFLKTNI